MSLRKQLEEIVAHARLNAVSFSNEPSDIDDNIKYETDQILTLFKESLPEPYGEGVNQFNTQTRENKEFARGHNIGYNRAIREVTQLLEEGLKHE